ncbi:MAG TPA: hypothetical protein V6C91_11785 [Coleofasciculaceae cyanobacterium]
MNSTEYLPGKINQLRCNLSEERKTAVQSRRFMAHSGVTASENRHTPRLYLCCDRFRHLLNLEAILKESGYYCRQFLSYNPLQFDQSSNAA